jgi:UDP-N-acetylmuramoylalanine--D-glutamate ligase
MSEPLPTEPPAAATAAPFLADRAVLVLGLGASGLAVARWCARAGARVTVADTRETPPQGAVLQQEMPQVQLVQASFDAALLEASGASLVVKSPGLAPAQIAPLLAAARTAGIAVTGELGLFAQALLELRQSRGYQPQVLAITGTNGKTTVTALTGQLLARAGKTVAVAGNIGPTLLDTLGAHLAADTLPAVWVLELSSFQLADSVPAVPVLAGAPAAFEPSAATVLNITQDHLDWHGDMAAYAQAKALVFGQRALMVLNQDDALVMALRAPAAKGRPQRACICFGAGMPLRAGDFGIEQVNGMAWLVRAMELDPTIKLRKGQEAEELHIQRLIPAEALRIRGRHNAVNALAALALAASTGCTLAPLLFGLREYQGEPHRVESIGVVGDVEYFDDSKGTNVGATVAALNGLGPERRLIPILGGDGKGQDFTPLAAPVARYARAVVLIGRDADQIRRALHGSGVELLAADTLPQAVRLASRQARTGDAVLLSPACASLDMFDNYVHRARVFTEAVQALALDAGTVLEPAR